MITESFGEKLCGATRQKLKFSEGLSRVTSGIKTVITPTVKHGGRDGPRCFAASGRLAVTDGNMNSVLKQKILQDNIRLCAKSTQVLQQDDDPKHRARPSEGIEKQNEGFGLAESKLGLKSDRDALVWP